MLVARSKGADVVGADEHLRQYRTDLLLVEGAMASTAPKTFPGPQDRQPARRRLAGDVAGLCKKPRAIAPDSVNFVKCRADREDRGR